MGWVTQCSIGFSQSDLPNLWSSTRALFVMLMGTNRIPTLAALLFSATLASACGGGSSGTSSSGSAAGSNPQQPPAPNPDTIAPSISTTLPSSDATGVPTATTVFVSFSELLDSSTVDQQSLVLSDQGVPIPGDVTFDIASYRLSFIPALPLSTDTLYTVTVANTLEDDAGNLFPGHSWFFTTGDSFNLGGTSQMTIDLCMDDGDKLMLTLVNNSRSISRDCGVQPMSPQPALSWDCLLDQAAVGHSTSMADNNFHAHVSPVEGSNPGDRINAAGYSPQAWGENIAAGYADEETVVKAWLDSPGHCSNIMSASFTQMGAGFARNPTSTYGIYWTQNFARPFN